MFRASSLAPLVKTTSRHHRLLLERLEDRRVLAVNFFNIVKDPAIPGGFRADVNRDAIFSQTITDRQLQQLGYPNYSGSGDSDLTRALAAHHGSRTR